MDGVRNDFLILLRAGLWGRDPMAEGFQRLGDEEWEEVFRMSGRQTVTGIVFDGICRLPDELQPCERLFAGWVVAVDRIEAGNRRMNAALKELAGLFAGNGLRPVLLKGQGVAELYPTPSHRECGDIDLYFPQGTIAEELIKSKGIDVSRMPDGSLSYNWKGIEIEHHPRMADLHSPRPRKWLKELEEKTEFIPSDLADGLSVPPPDVDALILSSHILKHALGKGIGLRQMCDLAMEYHRMHLDERCGELGAELFGHYLFTGILDWNQLLHAFLVGVIGLPEEELPYIEKPVSYEPLMRIVEDGGNFGQHRSRHGDTSASTAHRKHGERGYDRLVRQGHQPDEGQVRRKLGTAGMFVRRAGFSLRYAPGEAFWTVVSLVGGQFKSRRK